MKKRFMRDLRDYLNACAQDALGQIIVMEGVATDAELAAKLGVEYSEIQEIRQGRGGMCAIKKIYPKWKD